MLQHKYLEKKKITSYKNTKNSGGHPVWKFDIIIYQTSDWHDIIP